MSFGEDVGKVYCDRQLHSVIGSFGFPHVVGVGSSSCIYDVIW